MARSDQGPKRHRHSMYRVNRAGPYRLSDLLRGYHLRSNYFLSSADNVTALVLKTSMDDPLRCAEAADGCCSTVT